METRNFCAVGTQLSNMGEFYVFKGSVTDITASIFKGILRYIVRVC
jgi:hypothetical protein